MSKKHAVIAAAAATLAVGAGIGTFAAFNDSSTLAESHAAAGTLYFDKSGVQTGTWELGNLVPGQVLADKTFPVKNAGNLAGKLGVALKATGAPDVESAGGIEATAENGTITSDSELPKNLKAKIKLTVNGTSVWLVGDEGTWVDLTEGTGNIATVASTATQNLAKNSEGELTVSLAVKNAGNELQGDEADLQLTATLDQ